MPGEPQPLFSNQAIVDEKGFPTQYFIRWAQQRQKDINAGQGADQVSAAIDAWGEAHKVQAGTGLTGGGALEGNPELSIAATGVQAESYGDATHYVALTINAEGQVTAAELIAIPVLEAPMDGKQYVRQNGAWVALTTA